MATTKPLGKATTAPASLRRRVLLLALPAVGEQVLNVLVGLTDTFLVGNLTPEAIAQLGYDGPTALAGVGLANQIVWLVTVFFMAVSVASTALVARAKGAGDSASINSVLRQSLIIGMVMGALATMLTLLFAPQAIGLLGAPAEVLPRGATYLSITATTFLPAALLFIGMAALRGAGDTRTPLYIMLGVNAVNILLSWMLVNGNLGAPVMGVAGSAIGAAVARGGGGLFLIGLLLYGRSGLKLTLDLRPDWDVLKRLVRVGAPSGGEQLIFQGALLVFIRFVTSLGTVAYAAHNVVINIESLSFLPGLGYAVAASALVGQGLGAKKPEESEASAREALLQCGLMMSVLGVVMVLIPHQLIGIFAADPAVADTGANAMRIAGLMQPFLAINFVLSGALRGAGDTSWPLYVKLIGTWGVRLPVVMLLLWLGFGLTGVWIAMLADFCVQAGLAFWRFRSGKWKMIRI